MQNARWSQSLPSWALPLLVVAGVAGLALFGWKVFSSGSDYAGAPVPVHAGMYDLKAEVAKMQAAKSAAKNSPDK